MNNKFMPFLLLIVLLITSSCVSQQALSPNTAELLETPSLEASVPTPEPEPEPELPFEGKIAIVGFFDCQYDDYTAAVQMRQRYGEDKIHILSWSYSYMLDEEQMAKSLLEVVNDPEFKAVIINQATMGSNFAVDKLLEKRNDMFIAYGAPSENPEDVVKRANLVLFQDELAMGPAMVRQAKAMGAKKFVHYSFPRHMNITLLANRRDEMMKTCEEEGLEFIGITAIDPTSDPGVPGAQQYILEDVPKQIAKHGEDTAFFSTNCSMQIPLIATVLKYHGIYPQPCCPSPYHGFPAALGIEAYYDEYEDNTVPEIKHIINETKRIASENNMTGRMSTWPVSGSMLYTGAATKYAIKWINGEVPKEGLNIDVLAGCGEEYIMEQTDENVEVYFSPYSEDGTTYDNYLLAHMGYITY